MSFVFTGWAARARSGAAASPAKKVLRFIDRSPGYPAWSAGYPETYIILVRRDLVGDGSPDHRAGQDRQPVVTDVHGGRALHHDVALHEDRARLVVALHDDRTHGPVDPFHDYVAAAVGVTVAVPVVRIGKRGARGQQGAADQGRQNCLLKHGRLLSS